MRKVSIPHCCTADLLYGMGRSSTSDLSAERASNDTPYGFARELVEMVLDARDGGKAQLLAIVNSDQKVADTILRRLGSTRTPWMASRAHRTLTRTHILPVQKIFEKVLRPRGPSGLPVSEWKSYHFTQFINSLSDGL